MNNSGIKNNQSLYAVDIAKFVCAVAVIGCHTQVFSCFGDLANYFSFGVLFRVGVAFFFVCSGYFFFDKIEFLQGKIIKSENNRKRLIQYLVRLTILYIIWSAIYFIFQFIQWLRSPDITFFHLLINFAKSFVVDGSYYHLWYILCLIYSIPLLYFLLRRINYKTVIISAVLLYALHLIINYNEIFNISSHISIVNKYLILSGAFGQTLFIAIPLVASGGYIATNQCGIKKPESYFLLIISLLLLLAESALIYASSGKIDYSSYIIFTFVTSVIGFLAVKNIDLNIKNKKAFYSVRNMSTLIYCLHPLIIKIVKNIINFDRINSIIWFLIITALTIIVSYILLLGSKKVKFFKYFY